MEQAIGEKEKSDMKKKIHYTDEPVMLGKTVKDFLPPPGELALKDKTTKVSIDLNEESVKFFKKEARKTGVPYQRLIRKVVDLYVQHYA